ncbi:U32 family peptidase [Desulfobacter hydrogenophilus]|uniref:U32 family peptidase n=1 Tax=Desulfobacter hydrogenophilus TaxID=2291 RepID=A0A328FG73_9BACT|nr:peptidase U32 family protein [Desulfobacter hydrogenophilus]NDY71588.1 U32 family peptidase [Desulfobacter hydrogenophilus]QBH15365.1 U32 family peptidase [Desulfobacter hydrogenophilus]RAM02442.1 U32 family peptidase [Desulfobacter hydrogenophilus]
MTCQPSKPPTILAPAGDMHSFLAAIAASADAIYCGLKIFSARMEAGNFSIEELARLTKLAHSKGIEVYVAFNSIIKESETDQALRILDKLTRYTDVDALIIQDTAMVSLAEQAGFKGKLHLSTLGNCTHPAGLEAAQKAGFSRVVLPREFSLDDIKTMAAAVPGTMDLEVFVHGALCYSVSGRCYWSSWFGGKSALRGRCVQPCRRLYEQNGKKTRYFSCMDLSADVLAKVLKEIPNISTWKIEGRKKSPHYVYYTVMAYKLLRDTPEQKKQALSFLAYALGRQGSHYNLLSHRVSNPLDHASDTGSGLFLGRIKNPENPYFISREALVPGDLLRIGYEEETFHQIQKVTRTIPKKGKYFLTAQKGRRINKGTSVFMIDRKGRELETQLSHLGAELDKIPKVTIKPSNLSVSYKHAGNKMKSSGQTGGHRRKKQPDISKMDVFRKIPSNSKTHNDTGFWISANSYGIKPPARAWLWLDPVLFPEEERICQNYIKTALKKGAKNFVLNSPWQIALFDNPQRLNIWAGPFCNITNNLTVEMLKSKGFSGAIVSPELESQTLLSLPRSSCLPLGAVCQANWPVAISRIVAPDLTVGKSFTSPMGEVAWTSKYNATYHTFPNWILDLSSKTEELKQAGFVMLVNLFENIPKGVRMKPRPGTWNWHLKLL